MQLFSSVFCPNIWRSSIYIVSNPFSSAYLWWRRSFQSDLLVLLSSCSLSFSFFTLFWSSSVGASFSCPSALYLFEHFPLRSILSSFPNKSSWTLFFKFFKFSKRYSNVLRCVSSSFILFHWRNRYFWIFSASETLHWFFSFLLQNQLYFVH